MKPECVQSPAIPTANRPMRLEVFGAAEINQVAPLWRDLYRDAWSKWSETDHAGRIGATISTRYEWTQAWVETFDPGDNLIVLAAFVDQELVAILPLWRHKISRPSRYQLAFVSSGSTLEEEIYPEYVDVLARPDHIAAASEKFQRHIDSNISHIQEIFIGPTSNKSPIRAWPHSSWLWPSWVSTGEIVTAPYADLSNGFEAYLAKLSQKSRSNARRLLRQAEKEGISINLAGTVSEALTMLEELIELHSGQWESQGERGAFHTERLIRFHRRFVELTHHDGTVVLARLKSPNTTEAILYGFRLGQKFDGYQSGIHYDSGSTTKSPGFLAHLLIMQKLSFEGLTCYDFMAGHAFYKDQLKSAEYELYNLHRRKISWPLLSLGRRKIMARLRKSVFSTAADAKPTSLSSDTESAATCPRSESKRSSGRDHNVVGSRCSLARIFGLTSEHRAFR